MNIHSPIKSTRRGLLPTIVFQTAMLVVASSVHASPIVVTEAALSAPAIDPATIVHFDEVALGSPINGLTIKGFTFSENAPNVITSNGGPGAPNHIFTPQALSNGAVNLATYVLTINMPTVETSFGFGFVLNLFPAPSPVTITLFNGITNLGSLTYAAPQDPTFAGGFAGIGSTAGFTSVEIRFSPSASAFGIDNIAAAPEPSSVLLLLGSGLPLLRRRRRAAA